MRVETENNDYEVIIENKINDLISLIEFGETPERTERYLMGYLRGFQELRLINEECVQININKFRNKYNL